MRYAIISDIHSNVESLREFLLILPKLKIQKIICVGDIVGYNVNPIECIKIVSNLKSIETIRGNHDRAVAFGDYNNFSKNAKKVVKWTIKNIDRDSAVFLKNLGKGPKIIDQLFAICHGSTLNEDKYILSAFNTRDDFDWIKKNQINFLFFGHTHFQRIYCLNTENEIEKIEDDNIVLNPQNYYLVNPGSIGQPRDNDPRPSFIIFDSNKLTINVIRYEYPYHITQQKILNQNLPTFLADRLGQGR